MTRLAPGFDPAQWRALVRTGLRHDLRRAGRALGLSSRAHPALGLLWLVLLQAGLGAVISIPMWARADLLPGAVLHFTFLALTVASWLLLDGSALILSPADRALVAPRPVHPRTFMLARAATLLALVSVLAGAQAAAPVAAAFLSGGFHPLRGVLTLIAAASVTLTTAASVVATYAAATRAMPARYQRLGLTTLQLGMTLALYTLLVLLPGRVGRAYLLDPIEARPWWIWWLPSTWAADLAVGTFGWWKIAIAVTVAALACGLAARTLSIADDEALATAPDPVPRQTARRQGRWFRRPETRAVAVLARAQFRDDLRFRLAVLSIVPLTVVYFVLGASDEAASSHGHPALVYMALLLFPAVLKGAFVRTDAYRAAWLFYTSPASAGRLVLALKNVLASWFLLPYAAAVGLLLLFYLGRPFEALVSITVAGLTAHTLLLVMLLIDPELPFSAPPQAGTNTRSVMVAIVPAVLLGQALPHGLMWLTASPGRALAGLAGLLAANVALETVLRVTVDRIAHRVEFAG